MHRISYNGYLLPFLEENSDEFDVFEYNALLGASEFNSTFSKFNLSGKRTDTVEGDGGIEAAIEAAEELPQVRVFRWRAYAVAVNAYNQDGTWYLKYYDPIVKAKTMDSSSPFKLIVSNYGSIAGNYGSVDVKIDSNKAVVANGWPSLLSR